jgi:quercetin dioxygenase-like cupin family protein
MMPTIVRVNDVDPVEMVSGVWRRTLATGDRMMIAHVTLDEGATVPMHSHPHEQVGYVVEGRIRMTIAGQDGDFEPGDSYFIPGDVEHAATAITDCIVLDIFSPPRDEYRTETTS